ncbi:pilus (MSHA type) biogenesis protein MshL [Campylobacter sp. RM12327]|uniref:pilus (MSHA type) biogenesis protein MshL n=1 Tax=Campylobacter sputorum TaxID=206 RepID=UPI000B7714FA|nr:MULTISPECIES: pilus (MSHA type) biogenesis protein MshL [Campylobacter]ASM40145.1 transformation system, type II secretion system secretin protein CtsD [Campylobacter sputorum]MBE7358559.1 pilus (MSHA type) biogenesis protein MshL [Campylobacter sp. RM11302]MBF6669901.1 pilus (MSHA type) biogenesis protein MshL [Campylobacter sp. RM12327]MBF6675157.1 pilus (MSHA type) biogenesis protein MshL [Campylobacter sp. RM13538]MBF6676421.1 pilus (MSHA type) biogenesis protein MshL [Campylobacter sp.
MSLYQIIKKNKLIYIVCVLLMATSLYANCENRLFNLKVSQKVTLNEILNQFSDMCNFSIITKDQNATMLLNNEVSSINIKNLKLDQIFNLLLAEKNINYNFDKNILKISSLDTKTFKIDYITSIREGTAVIKASVDSAPVEVGEEDNLNHSNNNNLENLDNSIKTTEKFDFWANLQAELLAVLNNGSESIKAPMPIINQNAGLITVTGTKSQLDRIEEYIKLMQQRLKKQVILDVNIISVELENEYKKGVDWSKFQIGFNSYLGNDPTKPSGYTWGNRNERSVITKGPKYDNGILSEAGTWAWDTFPGLKSSQSNGAWRIGANVNFNLDGVLNFLETKGRTKVVSSPKVMTLNNQQALITVGDNINYRVQEESTNDNTIGGRTNFTWKQYSVFIGILLNILPSISDDDKIMLRINPSLSNFKYDQDNAYQGNLEPRVIAPDTLQKKLSTVVQVNNGDTVIIGGLIGETKGKDNTKVPFLGDLPYIGNLFSSTRDKVSTTELIFLVTPRIIETTSTPVQETVRELGFSKSLINQ